MNEIELRKKLNQPYNQKDWKEIVEFVFPHFAEFAGDQSIPIHNEYKDVVESFNQLGHVRLNDGKNLAVFELKLKQNVNILRSRVKLNDIVSKTITQDVYHGVLAVFEQGKDDYRFTFSAKTSEFDEDAGDFINKKTDTKRFTYVLGKNESCRTAAERFYKLSEQKDKADINAIEHAFSVEMLSKNFFKEYKQHYQMFVDYLANTPSYYTAVFKNEDKAIRDFVKLLLGRLVFIKFVQKKGWLGVPATEKGWENGNYQFIEDSFKNFEHQDNFYSQFLNPLFFEGFDKSKRSNDVFALTNTKVPFLSGGLFDNEDPKTKTINFPKAYFESLFDFFERYNFTIDENDTSMDQEVGIDPEMLGHIFENLLEDNKDKGAFYTPKEIVRYMCQESLKEYLKTYLQVQKQWSNDAAKQKELEDSLHKFVTLKEAAGIIDLDATLAKALKDVKICDPAIGSGAFPMGLLNEIFQLVHKLYEASPDKVGDIWKMDFWQPDTVKLNIIQQSIYGVDIEKGAVDIARLRFWLSLIVDSKEPQALPHLDYKIVVGDSLVSKLEDTIIDIDWDVTETNAQTDMFGNSNVERRKAILERITEKQKQVFDPNCVDDTLSLDIRNLKIDLLINQLELMIKTQGLEDKPLVAGKNLKKQTELWLLTKEWKGLIKKLNRMMQGVKTPLEFFDWKLDFPEIMNPEMTDRTGFDIVIGNPPYVSAPTMVKSNLRLRNEIIKSKKYSTLYQKWDLFIPFMELGLQLLNFKGIFTMIVPYPLTNQNYGKKLRELIINQYNLKEIVDLNGTKIFENATVSNCIPFISNSKPKNECFISFLCEHGKIERKFLQNYSDLVQDEKTLVWNLTSEKRQTTRHTNLNVFGDYCYISKGMVLNADEKTAKGAFSKDDLISEIYDEVHCRKYLEAKDIERYNVKRIRYLEYNTKRSPDKLSRQTFRELYMKPKLLINCLGSIAVTMDIDNQFLHNHSLYCSLLWKDLEGIQNKSISTSVKRYSNLPRKEMVELSEGINLRYLVGILNSKYASVLLTNLRGGDYHIYPQHIRNIPIPRFSGTEQILFIEVSS